MDSSAQILSSIFASHEALFSPPRSYYEDEWVGGGEYERIKLEDWEDTLEERPK